MHFCKMSSVVQCKTRNLFHNVVCSGKLIKFYRFEVIQFFIYPAHPPLCYFIKYVTIKLLSNLFFYATDKRH